MPDTLRECACTGGVYPPGVQAWLVKVLEATGPVVRGEASWSFLQRPERRGYLRGSHSRTAYARRGAAEIVFGAAQAGATQCPVAPRDLAVRDPVGARSSEGIPASSGHASPRGRCAAFAADPVRID